MSRSSSSCIKSFDICVILDILDVTCPGVWICPRGMVYLDIWLFGCNSNTSYVEPKFPLAFDETFSFHENFTEIANLRDVQKSLEEKCVRIALVQVYEKKRITLATYKNNVDDVLYPERNRLSGKGEISVFMKNEPFFPGTISPKITLVTKTSVTERILTTACRSSDGDRTRIILQSSRYSSKERRFPPDATTTKPVHHDKFTNALRNDEGNRTLATPVEAASSITDSDTDSQPYCQRTIKIDCSTTDGGERHPNKTCKYCDEDVNRSNVTENGNKSSRRDHNIGTPSKPTNKTPAREHENNAIATNECGGKSVKATFKVKGHRHECGKSNDEDCVRDEPNARKTEHRVNDEHCAEEPRKLITPKINLHLDVHYCKCGVSNCASSPSWRNICREVDKNDATGDAIKYHAFLRNHYRRLYDSATHQLFRNLL